MSKIDAPDGVTGAFVTAVVAAYSAYWSAKESDEEGDALEGVYNLIDLARIFIDNDEVQRQTTKWCLSIEKALFSALDDDRSTVIWPLVKEVRTIAMFDCAMCAAAEDDLTVNWNRYDRMCALAVAVLPRDAELMNVRDYPSWGHYGPGSWVTAKMKDDAPCQ
jgi:hypothetical protein